MVSLIPPTNSFFLGEQNEQLNYGRVTIIGDIVQPNKDVFLNGSNSKWGVIGKSITANDSQAFKISAIKDVNLTRTNTGDVKSFEGNIQLVGCQELKNLEAKGFINAIDCQKIGTVSAKGFVKLQNCPLVDSIRANNGITLENTKILYSIQAKGMVNLIKSYVRSMDCTPYSTMPEFKGSVIGTLNIKRGIKKTSGGRANKYTILPNGKVQKIVFSRMENKQVIKLTDCVVKEIFFDNEVEGEVILVGTSKVKKIKNGIVRQETIEEAET